jgi:hypothetical protein
MCPDSAGIGRYAEGHLLLRRYRPKPVVMEEATYMWTRVMPVFFIAMALSPYRDGLRKNDSFVHLFGLSGRLNRLNQVRKPIVKRAREIGPVTV